MAAPASSNAEFIDKLLDKWDAAPNYFKGLVDAGVSGGGPGKITNIADIQKKIRNLYLVFHYPQYKDPTVTTNPESHVFDTTSVPPTPDIQATHRVFNYIYNEPTTGGAGDNKKTLLSSQGIAKENMVNLKMLLESLVETTTTDETAYALLEKPPTNGGLITGTLYGGIKSTGGRNKNRSNKKMKKLRKRNKSSKSVI